jgi:hypothetical protein
LKNGLNDGLTMVQIEKLVFDVATKYCDANQLDEDDREQYLGDLDGVITLAIMESVSELYCENKRLKTIIAKVN